MAFSTAGVRPPRRPSRATGRMPPDALGHVALAAPTEGFVEGDQVGSRSTAALHQSVFGSVERTLRLKKTEEVRLGACRTRQPTSIECRHVVCHCASAAC